MFNLKKPCVGCPFLKDTPTPLHHDRLPDIVEELENGSVFTCHKTVDYDTQFDDNGDHIDGFIPKNQFCAGALIFMEKQDIYPQQVRMAERLGLYHRDQYRDQYRDQEKVIDDLSERKTI